ncbi:hypothetical protein L5M43_16935 [Shewanella sp. SW36]|uniref:hypothetical protein n=1 Tax=unclassified Shewanella TaxID=196818 RepID=UPI0021DB785C|nr:MULTISPECIES: hypothetical protein [unclassified Shewanella]MCU7976921.1 hypothetical protein [Shewanella sp. SW36]MCU7992161.1 hypothetical protein [Shewanella sp. SW1]MCU8053929.1 hypothetical protein [Shewanella sp. SM43]
MNRPKSTVISSPTAIHEKVIILDDQTEKYELPKWILTMIAIIASIALALLSTYFLNFNGSFGNQGDFGTFGDFLGGVLNPILGFATVFLLIWSLKMQVKELALSNQQLALTRQELKETKEETALSRKAMEAQVEHLQKEAKLNELIRLLNDLKTTINNRLSGKFVPHVFLAKGGRELNLPDEISTYATILSNQLPSSYKNEYWYIRCSQREQQKGMFQQVIHNPNLQGWSELERVVIVFCNLVIKYDEISPSDEFNSVYIYEAYDYLAPLCETLRSEQLIQTMNDLGFEFEFEPEPELVKFL